MHLKHKKTNTKHFHRITQTWNYETLVSLPFMTSSQKTQWAYCYNPGVCTRWSSRNYFLKTSGKYITDKQGTLCRGKKNLAIRQEAHNAREKSHIPYVVMAAVSDKKVSETIKLAVQLMQVVVDVPVLRAHSGYISELIVHGIGPIPAAY